VARKIATLAARPAKKTTTAAENTRSEQESNNLSSFVAEVASAINNIGKGAGRRKGRGEHRVTGTENFRLKIIPKIAANGGKVGKKQNGGDSVQIEMKRVAGIPKK